MLRTNITHISFATATNRLVDGKKPCDLPYIYVHTHTTLVTSHSCNSENVLSSVTSPKNLPLIYKRSQSS